MQWKAILTMLTSTIENYSATVVNLVKEKLNLQISPNDMSTVSSQKVQSELAVRTYFSDC